MVLRGFLLIGCFLWLTFWSLVLIGRFEADPVAAVAGLLLLAGWFALRRRSRS
jgi:hypothetical protein